MSKAPTTIMMKTALAHTASAVFSIHEFKEDIKAALARQWPSLSCAHW
jgi:hypothetical protein